MNGECGWPDPYVPLRRRDIFLIVILTGLGILSLYFAFINSSLWIVCLILFGVAESMLVYSY